MKTRCISMMNLIVSLGLLLVPHVPSAAEGSVAAEAGKVQSQAFDAPATQESSPAGTEGWVIECVDCPKTFSDMGDRSLRVDAAGHPHIAYGGDHLYYAWHDGTAWHFEIVDSADGVGSSTSLVLDEAGYGYPGGYPHISYYGNEELKYAYRDVSGWHIQTVDSEGRVGEYTSLALDGAGFPHISYFDYTNGDLKYAHRDATGWHIQTVDGAWWAGLFTSLALDEAGYPHISYMGGRSLKYVYRDASGWHIQTVDKGRHDYDRWYTSLALDRAGYPHISYHARSDSALKYAYRDASGWHIQTVDSAGDGGWHTSLALDAASYPHIGYFDYTNGALKYAYRDASDWHIQIIDSEGEAGLFTSLALDGAGHPHISYCAEYPDLDLKYAYRDLALKYAYRDATGWHIQTVDSGTRFSIVGWYTSLALDGAGYGDPGGHPHISYYDWGNDDLKYAYRDATGWHIQTVDSEGGRSTSLALDGADHPHISYSAGYSVSLEYAYRDASGWHIQTVDTGLGLYSEYTSLALDRTGHPHISYWDNINDALKYAYRDASGWHIQTVDSGLGLEFSGGLTSLALDGAGYPHISYSDRTNYDLGYAYRDATDWYIQTVDSAGVVGTFTSLALDGGGYPHIGYSDGTNGDLRYAYRDATGWHIQTVDSEGYVGSHTSLALDGAGYPHISYHDGTNSDLKYAYRDASGWHIQTVDSAGDVGHFTSLALDEAGHPHISYYHRGNGNLKYARLQLPHLSMDKRATPSDGLRNNDTLTYTLTLSGPGLNVFLWDPLPANVHYITGSVTPPAVYSPAARAIAWQGRLPTNTVQLIRFQVTPGITGPGSLDLSLPIVNTAWLTDTRSGRSVLATVIVNGQRVHLPLIVRKR